MTENAKRIIPLVIEVEDKVPEKLRRFFERTTVEYQMEAIKLWAWRSELPTADVVFAEPMHFKTDGSAKKELWEPLIGRLLKARATGVVACAANIMMRGGLDQEFVQEVRKNGIEIWTSESVAPVPEEELSVA